MLIGRDAQPYFGRRIDSPIDGSAPNRVLSSKIRLLSSFLLSGRGIARRKKVEPLGPPGGTFD